MYEDVQATKAGHAIVNRGGDSRLVGDVCHQGDSPGVVIDNLRHDVSYGCRIAIDTRNVRALS
jgi:hypothetical protein